MLEKYFNHSCTLYTQTVDEYNDIRTTNSVLTSCHYRDNNSLNSNTPNREEEPADGMAWFRASETVDKGDVLTVDGNSYRIVRVVKARKLGSTTVEFIKCWLERFDSFVS